MTYKSEQAAEPRLEKFVADGFDQSYVYELDEAFTDGEPSGEYSIRIRCSQCEALVINGVPCHETGCPNTVRETDIDEDSVVDDLDWTAYEDKV